MFTPSGAILVPASNVPAPGRHLSGRGAGGFGGAVQLPGSEAEPKVDVPPPPPPPPPPHFGRSFNLPPLFQGGGEGGGGATCPK